MPTWNAEKPALRSTLAFLLWVLVMFPSSTWAALIAFMESPAAGPVAGVQIVRGWAFATESGEMITRVDLVVDGESVLAIPCCGARADVAAAYPQYPSSVTLQSGWGLTLNWNLLPPGSHIVQVEIATNQGAVWTSEPRMVEVLTLGDFEFVDQLTLAGATARLDGDEIVLDGVQVRDQASGQEQALTLRLRWDPAAQSLAVSGAVTTATMTSLRSTLRGLLSPVWTWLARTTSMGTVYAVIGIQAHWESPSEGQVAAGIGVLRGWMFAEEPGVPITSVRVLLDGVAATTMPCCSARGDVAAAFPDNPNALESGAGLVLNYGELRAGPHTLGLEIEAANGAALALSRAVLVLKLGGFAFLDLFDLADAGVRIAGEDLILEHVRVRDKTSQRERTVSARFRWDVSSQAFVLVANDPPIAHDQSARTPMEQPVSLFLIATDADGDPVRYEVVEPPSHGVLVGAPPNVIYTPAVGFTGQDHFTFRAHDFVSPSNVATVAITVESAPTSVPPVVDLDPTNSTGQRPNFVTTFTEDDGPTPIVSLVMTVADPDSAALAAATLTLTNLRDAGQEVLAVDPATVAPTTPLIAAYDAASGVLSLSGSASVAAYQAALRTLTYDNASQHPDPTPRIITVIASDGAAASTPVTSTVNVRPVNDQPTFTASDPPAVGENAGPQTLPNWATFDPGAPEETGQTVLAYTVSAVSTPSLFATPPAVAATGTLTYTPANSTIGTSTFTVTVRDNGGTANGGVDTSAPQTFTITVTAVDDPPTAVDDAATVTEDDPATTINVLANDTDPDGGPMSIASVTQSANGAVVIANGGADLTYQPDPDYCNTPPGTTLDTFTYTLAPGGSTATVSVTVTCVEDAPVVDLNGPAAGVDFAATFTEGTPAVIIDAGQLTVTDPDSANLATATIALTNLQDVGLETLTATTTGTAITANYVEPVLTLTGADTVAHYQQVLRTVTYNNTSLNPNTTARVVTFVVNDGTTDSATATSTVTVQAVNSAPSFTKGADQTVLEDAGAQTVAGWATGMDDGDPGVTQTLTFTITSNTNPSLFSAGPTVNATTGDLTYTPAANANGAATISIALMDNGGTANGGQDTSAPQSFTIAVTAVNDAPSFTVGPDQTVNEDAGPQTVNPWATAVSPGPANEAGQTLTFSITGNTNAALFSAGPAVNAAGVLTYTPAPGAVGSATITVQLMDDGGTANGGVDTSAPQTFTITVTAVDDPPVAVDDAATVTEDDPATPIAVLANDTDVDGGPIGIVSVTQPANGAVVITNGGVNLTYQPDPDYCNTPPGTLLDTFTYTLTPGSSTATVSVTVTCVNDAPVVDLNGAAAGVDFAATFTEGTPAVIVDAANLTVTDVDNTTLATATITITNLQDAGLETLTADTTGTTITAAYVEPVLTLTGADTLAHYQQVLRTVTYNNTSQNPNTTARLIEFVVNDGSLDSATATSTVTVQALNSAPSFTAGADQTVLEDAGPQAVGGWATAINDGDGGGQMLTFNVTNNTNAGLFSAGPVVSAAGNLTYTPAANANGTATITLTLSDDGGTANGGVDTSAPQSFTITVTAVNDAPSFTVGPDQTVNEDAGPQMVNPWATGISAGPADEASQMLTFSVTNNTNAALFSAGPSLSAAGVLTYIPAADAFGSATITVQLMDDGGTANGGQDTTTHTFIITINAVNDAPSFTVGPDQTVDEDAGPQTVNPWATSISAGPANESGQTLTFNITDNTNAALFSAGPSINTAGVLTYTPAPDANGSATITVVLMDNGGTANGGVDSTAPQSFTITVNPVNDPPVASNQTYTAQANMQRSLAAGSGLLVGATDVESGTTLTVGAVSATTPAGGTVTVNPSTGAFDFDPPPGVTGDVTFTYEVCDDGIPGPGVCSAPATVTVTVVGPVIWFVQQGAAGSNDGRLSNPFTSLGSVPGVDSANDGVFLFAGTYSDGLTLLTGEQLIGQGVTGASFDSVFGISPPAGTLARPAINGARPTVQDTLTLNTDAVVRGLNLATTTTTALTDPAGATTGVTVNEVEVSATTATAVSFNDLSGTVTLGSTTSGGGTNNVNLLSVAGTITLGSGALSGASGTAFNVNTGTATISYSGSITNTAAARLVSIVSKSSGNVTLSGNLSGTGSSTGINIQNNTTSGTIAFTGGSKVLTTGTNAAVTLDNNDNATLNFSGGGLVITTTSGVGFNAMNGATAINVSGAGNTITSTTGTALNVNNSTIGGLGLTFQSITANGATNGTVLNTTGVLGGLTVTGDGGGSNNGSGGTIQNTTGAGVVLDNVGNVSLNYMNITSPGTDGIRATTLTNGLTVNRSNISDSSGTAPADKGIDIGDFSTGTPVSGTINITNTVIGPASGSSPHDSLAIGISSGTSTWNVTNTTFRNTGNSGINMELRGSSVVTAFTVTGSTFAGAGSTTSARGIFVNTLDDSVMTLMTIDANTFTNNNIHIDLNQQNDTDPVGSHTFEILDNTTMTGANSHAINIFAAAGSFGGAFTGRIEGNTIGNSGVAGSGSAIGNGIRVNINGGSDATMLLDDNIIRQTPNGRGIEIIARNGTGGLDVTVTNNDVNPQAVSDPLAAILVQSNCLTVCNTVRSDVRNNTVPSATDVTDLLTTYIALVESSTSTLELVDTTAPITGSCASELAATNTGSTSVLGGCELIIGPINTPP